MSVKIPLSYTIAGAFSIFALSAAYGMEWQKKYYKKLFKLSFTSRDEMTRKFAKQLIFEDLRIQLEPPTKED